MISKSIYFLILVIILILILMCINNKEDFFSKKEYYIYYINLSHRHDRKKKMEQEFLKMNNLNNYTFINERIDSSPRLHVMETFFKFPSKLGIKKRCYDKDLNIKYIENRLLLNKKYIYHI